MSAYELSSALVQRVDNKNGARFLEGLGDLA
jgi:hypothetical protein